MTDSQLKNHFNETKEQHRRLRGIAPNRSLNENQADENQIERCVREKMEVDPCLVEKPVIAFGNGSDTFVEGVVAVVTYRTQGAAGSQDDSDPCRKAVRSACAHLSNEEDE